MTIAKKYQEAVNQFRLDLAVELQRRGHRLPHDGTLVLVDGHRTGFAIYQTWQVDAPRVVYNSPKRKGLRWHKTNRPFFRKNGSTVSVASVADGIEAFLVALPEHEAAEKRREDGLQQSHEILLRMEDAIEHPGVWFNTWDDGLVQATIHLRLDLTEEQAQRFVVLTKSYLANLALNRVIPDGNCEPAKDDQVEGVD